MEVEGDEDEEDRVRLQLLLRGITEPKVLVLLCLLPQNNGRMEIPKEVLTRLGLLELKPIYSRIRHQIIPKVLRITVQRQNRSKVGGHKRIVPLLHQERLRRMPTQSQRNLAKKRMGRKKVSSHPPRFSLRLQRKLLKTHRARRLNQ